MEVPSEEVPGAGGTQSALSHQHCLQQLNCGPPNSYAGVPLGPPRATLFGSRVCIEVIKLK